jgi:hypothetical protein
MIASVAHGDGTRYSGLMVSSSVRHAGRELRTERELTAVHYEHDLDAGWRFTDAAGHRHHCEYEAADHYPTLRRVTDRVYWCEGCCDEHDDSHLECRQCGEHVVPGITGPGVMHIWGPVTYYLDGEPVSAEQAEAFIAQLPFRA